MRFLFVYILNKCFSFERCDNSRVGGGFGGGWKCWGEQAAVFALSWEDKAKSSLQAALPVFPSHYFRVCWSNPMAQR